MSASGRRKPADSSLISRLTPAARPKRWSLGKRKRFFLPTGAISSNFPSRRRAPAGGRTYNNCRGKFQRERPESMNRRAGWEGVHREPRPNREPSVE